MEYGNLLRRSANIVWQHKFLIVLGVLAGLGSGSFGGGGGGGGGNGNGQPGQLPDIDPEFAAVAIGAALVIFCLLIAVALVVWALSTIARGGLIAGVDAIESGRETGLGHAWRAGWRKGVSLIGISLLPGIPALILLVVAGLAAGVYGGLFALFGEPFSDLAGATALGAPLAIAACVVVPVVLALSIVRNFAERACMLEDLGVIDSYRRGLNVLMGNLGEAIILFLLQIVLFIVLGVLFFLPGLILVLCCFLWPLLLIINGAVTAFVSALWTLAWRTWTGRPSGLKEVQAAA